MIRKMNWFARLSVGAVLLLALAVGAHWWLGSRAEHKLARLVAEVAARGEPTRVEDLNRNGVADEDNAAVDLRSAARAMNLKSAAWERFDRYDLKLPLHEEERAAMRGVVEENAESLRLVRAARGKKGAAWRVVFQSPMIHTLLPDLREQHELSSLVFAEMLLAHERGDHGEVVERARDGVAMARAQRVPTLVSYMVGMSVAQRAARHAGDAAVGLRIGAGPGDASPEQTKALIAELLDETWATDGLVRAMQGERVMMLDVLDRVNDGSLSLFGPLNGPGPSPTLAGAVAYAGKPAVFKDAAVVLRFEAQLIAQVRSARDWPTIDNGVAPPPGGAMRSMFRVASLMTPGLKRSAQRHFATLANRRLAATALAIRMYAVDHEAKLPARLDDLVPRYLPAVPLDPMLADGSILKYIGEGEDPRVYSVGADGADDGGAAADERRPLDIVMHLTRQERPAEEDVDEESDDE